MGRHSVRAKWRETAKPVPFSLSRPTEIDSSLAKSAALSRAKVPLGIAIFRNRLPPVDLFLRAVGYPALARDRFLREEGLSR